MRRNIIVPISKPIVGDTTLVRGSIVIKDTMVIKANKTKVWI